MSKASLASALLLSVCLGWTGAARAAVVYRSNEGWSVEGDASTVVEPDAVSQMRKAEALEASGNPGGALNAYRALVKKFPNSILAPKAQRKVGLLLEHSGQYELAFAADETYLTKYTRGDDFEPVVDSMFRIAKLFLDGQKKKMLGMRLAGSMSEAQRMMESIVAKAPFSKWAPLAQYSVGQALERQTKFPEAIAAYQVVVAKYPTDAIADDALYQVGYVRLREFREGSNDRASSDKAREAFEDFINRYPQSEKVPQARENLKTLEGGQRKNVLQIARFYDRTKQYKAAVIYYNDVIQQEPDSTDSEFAKKRIAALKAQVGDDALRAGPERAETGDRALARRKMQAKVDTASRPDYVGPPVVIAEQKIETAPGRPQLRTSPGSIGPVPPVEPALPGQPGGTPEALQPETGLPTPPPPAPAPAAEKGQ